VLAVASAGAIIVTAGGWFFVLCGRGAPYHASHARRRP
jgi:hypothetical protein